MVKVSAIVLAAGLSQRMAGGKKLFLKYGSRTILEEVLYQLSKSDVDEVIIVVNELSIHDINQIVSRDYQNYRVIENYHYKLGMTSSIQVGVSAIGEDTSGYMICLADMPKIDSSVYRNLTSAFRHYYANDSKVILAPTHHGAKGNPVIFSNSYRNDILEHQEMEGCKSIIMDNSGYLKRLEVGSDGVLLDIDTPENYDSLKA
ncbi:MAG: nucleotidyltransferase family protein [Bacteroidota bacterium]